MESSVDLPHPEGPDMATYSPFADGKMHARQRVGFDFIGVEDLGHGFNVDQRLAVLCHVCAFRGLWFRGLGRFEHPYVFRASFFVVQHFPCHFERSEKFLFR